MWISFSQIIIWRVRLLFNFSCYLVHMYFQSYLKIFKHCCCCYVDALPKIPYLFMFLGKFQKFDQTKFKGWIYTTRTRYSNFRILIFMTSSNAYAWTKKSVLLNNLQSKHSLVMKFGQFMSYYKINILIWSAAHIS